MTEGDAALRWRELLEGWAIPKEILDQAPESPWGFPPEAFVPDPDSALTPSHQLALDGLPDGSVVLDVGAGGGAMSAPLRAKAGRIVAVDEQESMLDHCDADAKILGRWPDVAGQAGTADVVVCGNVFYNVAALDDFAVALDAAARVRVVSELTEQHPLVWTAPLWRRFWDLDRPSGPDWSDAVAVLEAAGLHPRVEQWQGERSIIGFRDDEGLARFMRRRLCLPESRHDEVKAAIAGMPPRTRRMATIWWDKR